MYPFVQLCMTVCGFPDTDALAVNLLQMAVYNNLISMNWILNKYELDTSCVNLSMLLTHHAEGSQINYTCSERVPLNNEVHFNTIY